MVIGILQFELLVHGAESLKDKRRVVRSVKDRLHREHLVSIAEVGGLDLLNLAIMGLAVVGADGRRVGEVLDHVCEKLRLLTDAELGDVRREIIHGRGGDADAGEDDGSGSDNELARELIDRASGTAEDQA